MLKLRDNSRRAHEFRAADDLLAERRAGNPGDVMAEAVIDYYRDMYAAERKAMTRILAAVTTR